MENDLPGRFDQAITKEKPTKMRVAQSARGDAGALRLADQRAVEIQARNMQSLHAACFPGRALFAGVRGLYNSHGEIKLADRRYGVSTAAPSNRPARKSASASLA